MKTMIRICLAVAVVGLLAGCATPRKVDTERRRAQRVQVLKIEHSDGAVLAGVDVFGVKEAFNADPAGTTGAITLDVILAAVFAFGVDWAADEFGGSDGKQGAKATAIPTAYPTAGLVVGGNDNSLTVPSTVISGPIYMDGNGNNVTVFEPAPATVTP
jgi:hypothetical protein